MINVLGTISFWLFKKTVIFPDGDMMNRIMQVLNLFLIQILTKLYQAFISNVDICTTLLRVMNRLKRKRIIIIHTKEFVFVVYSLLHYSCQLFLGFIPL